MHFAGETVSAMLWHVGVSFPAGEGAWHPYLSVFWCPLPLSCKVTSMKRMQYVRFVSAVFIF